MSAFTHVCTFSVYALETRKIIHLVLVLSSGLNQQIILIVLADYPAPMGRMFEYILFASFLKLSSVSYNFK
jgi:hypothetical protein